MIQTDERKMLRALEKIAENTGKIAKNLAADIIINRFYERPASYGEVTAEEALAAAKTIRDYCKQMPMNCDDCGICRWCESRLDLPEDWCCEEDADD